MELPVIAATLSSLLILSLSVQPTLAWRNNNYGRRRDVNLKSGFRESSVHSDGTGLEGVDKEGGRGFFFFEKNGKKLVGYMDYGDDKKGISGDPWQTEKDNVMTYSIPSSWKSDDNKKEDNVFAMAKPNTEQKIYYFTNNEEITPQVHNPVMPKPTTYHIYNHDNRQSIPQQPSHQESRSRSHSRYNMPVDQGEMFDHGYSGVDNDKSNFEDMDKRRQDYHEEFNQVQVRSQNKWDNFKNDRRPITPPHTKRGQMKPRRQEKRRPWKEIRMPMGHKMMELKPRRNVYGPKQSTTMHSRQPASMQRFSHKMKRMPMENVQLLYRSDDDKRQNEDDYDGKVYIMLPSGGKPKGELSNWINSDFFTDSFIESFHPSSINEKHSRQGRVIKVIPYYPNRYQNDNYKV